VDKPSRYATSHPGQFNLTVAQCVDAVSTSWGHKQALTVLCTGCDHGWQCKLVADWGL